MGSICGHLEEDKNKKENTFNEHPSSLNKNQIKIIYEQMNKSVCKIIVDFKGTGFLCMIPYPNIFNLLPVLISCNHVLTNDVVVPGNKLKLLFEGEEKIIEIDEERKVYKSPKKEFDVTIIELRKTDGFDFRNFLEVDESIYNNDNLNDFYKNKTVYVIHYPKFQEIKYSVDIIKSIDDSDINHFCTTFGGSSGSPILNLNNFKVIWIHKGNLDKSFNMGTVIKYPIEGFIKLYPPKIKKNEILLTLLIGKNDIKKEIYFLDNGPFEQAQNTEEKHNNLKSLMKIILRYISIILKQNIVNILSQKRKDSMK